jgi:hypothetical protein
MLIFLSVVNPVSPGCALVLGFPILVYRPVTGPCDGSCVLFNVAPVGVNGHSGLGVGAPG